MKRNLILSIIACGASLALCPGLHAQDTTPAPATTTGTASGPEGHPLAGHHRGGGNPLLERLTTELSLTADQQAKVKPILEASHAQMQTIRQDVSLTKEDKMAKMKDARESMHSQINALLDPDQQTKYAAMLENCAIIAPAARSAARRPPPRPRLLPRPQLRNHPSLIHEALPRHRAAAPPLENELALELELFGIQRSGEFMFKIKCTFKPPATTTPLIAI